MPSNRLEVAMSLFAHATRSIGLDGNPLRRGTDRVEGWTRLTATIIVLIVTPVVTGMAACSAYRDGARAEAAERIGRARTDAVLTQDAITSPSSIGKAPTVLTSASWKATDDTPRTGLIAATAGTTAGATLSIWINTAGIPTDPPRDHEETLAATLATAVLIPTGVLLIVGIVHLAVRIALDRRRFAQWQLAWQRIEPGWSGRDD
ncbi:MAG: hypothetical protein HKP61_00190 [Dactylosporangium sp.]|nr:hypothetical protein [Dactylosporangium sp.]NNJ59391.1 hypothetical protein [Dactylosporangium sp.]